MKKQPQTVPKTDTSKKKKVRNDFKTSQKVQTCFLAQSLVDSLLNAFQNLPEKTKKVKHLGVVSFGCSSLPH